MPYNCFQIKFWGVRGSIPCPGSETVRYGGNTSCVEMQVGRERLIFDGGTGLRILGQSLMTESPVKAHLFFSHSHWDHIQGFPFFTPAFIRGNTFNIYAVPSPNGATIKQTLHDQMLHPNFPVPLQIMRADLEFYNLEMGETLYCADFTVETRPLNHPGEAVGYRVNWQGLSAAYITDTEHFPDRLDDNVLALAWQADVMIIDATYTDEEYNDPKYSKVGWGHSTWQQAVKIAKEAQVKQLVLFHHDPAHNDDFLDRIGEQVRKIFPQTILAREGLSIELRPEGSRIDEA
ncbi:beta-lactamase domain protein [Microcystis aeruginosa NIES-3806]|uniref:Beta-lactamase domain protein n=2 Tax=Microcystis aeruginosa TaxID=1126 RepID=A0A6H9G5B7_MICAE|nr:MBL fold metallo-hydrolase [Microcystis aeruginosa]GCL45637.1 beta-lactamase domain protein [Microcystis aeruginosa NIES-3787]GCL55392.1 beta-lactamase domain protein [Microcystis aeruginosa NIES-3806]GCL58573.1 beta-lactamase domain protein [Microcystis aeruginosa NIES-3807]